jgi:hypothetical protein
MIADEFLESTPLFFYCLKNSLTNKLHSLYLGKIIFNLSNISILNEGFLNN